MVEPVKPTYPIYPTPPRKDEALRDLPKYSLLNRDGTPYNKKNRQALPAPDVYDPEYEQVLREMKERAELARLRPIEQDPYQYEREIYGNPTPTYIANTLSPKSSKSAEPVKDPFHEKKRLAFRDKLLSTSIPGSHYIDGESSQWKLFILRLITKNMANSAVNFSLSKIVNDLKLSGVTFNQKEELIQYPIRAFFDYY